MQIIIDNKGSLFIGSLFGFVRYFVGKCIYEMTGLHGVRINEGFS